MQPDLLQSGVRLQFLRDEERRPYECHPGDDLHLTMVIIRGKENEDIYSFDNGYNNGVYVCGICPGRSSNQLCLLPGYGV
jgi:hypothetical protein